MVPISDRYLSDPQSAQDGFSRLIGSGLRFLPYMRRSRYNTIPFAAVPWPDLSCRRISLPRSPRSTRRVQDVRVLSVTWGDCRPTPPFSHNPLQFRRESRRVAMAVAALRSRKRGDSENPDARCDINGLGPRLAARHRQGTCSIERAILWADSNG